MKNYKNIKFINQITEKSINKNFQKIKKELEIFKAWKLNNFKNKV